jgi:cephalosporin-C deacetylase
MPLFDLPLEQLRNYTSGITAPSDFDAFWDRTISEARGFPLGAVFEPVDNYLTVIDTFDVTFAGYGGSPVKGWLHLPANRSADTRLPARPRPP